jgi:hypothetical protein
MKKVPGADRASNGAPADRRSGRTNPLVVQIVEYERLRRKLKIGPELATVGRQAAQNAAEATYQRTKMPPLRRRAIAAAEELRAALRALAAADERSPRNGESLLLKTVVPLGRAPDGQPTAREAERTRTALLSLGTPPFVLKLLPYLCVRLEGEISLWKRKSGRPRDQARLAQEEIAPLHLSDAKVAKLLELEGLDGAAGDARERARLRRRRVRSSGRN